MKYWQLATVLRNARQQDLLASISEERDDWRQFGDWFRHEEDFIATQDRSKLDFQLPDEFVRAILRRVRFPYYESDDGRWLHYPRLRPSDHEISALEAYVKYGGTAIENAIEKGSTHALNQDTPGWQRQVERS